MQSSSSSPNTSSSSPPHLVNTANVPDGPDLNQHHLHPNPSRQPAPCASTSNDNGNRLENPKVKKINSFNITQFIYPALFRT